MRPAALALDPSDKFRGALVIGDVYPHFIYLIHMHSSDGPFSKVGISRNVFNRLTVLRNGSPLIMTLEAVWMLKSIDAALRFEARAHQHLMEHRVRNEWFKIDPVEAKKILDGMLDTVGVPGISFNEASQRLAANHSRFLDGPIH